jgi:hypothetical protein
MNLIWCTSFNYSALFADTVNGTCTELAAVDRAFCMEVCPMTLHRSLTLEIAVLLAWNSVPTRPAVLGVVAEADRAPEQRRSFGASNGL